MEINRFAGLVGMLPRLRDDANDVIASLGGGVGEFARSVESECTRAEVYIDDDGFGGHRILVAGPTRNAVDIQMAISMELDRMGYSDVFIETVRMKE